MGFSRFVSGFRPVLRPVIPMMQPRGLYTIVLKTGNQWFPKRATFLEGPERDNLTHRMASHMSPLKPATPPTSGAAEGSKTFTINVWIGGAERDNMAHRMRRHGTTVTESGKFGLTTK